MVQDLRETTLRSLIASQTGFVLVASAVVYGIYIAVAPFVAGKTNFPPPVENARLLIGFQKPFPERFLYVLRADKFSEFEDADEDDQTSPVILYEDDKPLGPSLSDRNDIEHLGQGRYAHLKGTGFLMSTSDNSDPRTNGRRYSAVVPPAGRSTVPPPVENARRLRRFEKPWPDRFVYTVRAERLREFEDADEDDQTSPVILYEDDKPLGPSHSDHFEIEKIGQGRYAHLKGHGILMSTSDNSDPRTNGRRYYAVVPADGQSTAPPPPVENALQLHRFQKPWPDRFVYTVRAERLREFEDADEDAQTSPMILYEDDKPLGRSHSDHADIEQFGQGRYAHLKGHGILMSTSDNSDPRTNGRRYYAVVPAAGQSTAPPPPVENALRLDRFQKPWPDRFVYIARAKSLHEFEDADEDKQKSPIILYEDDKPLGPSHSDHSEIERLGQGRYAHLKDQGILMSTSDNSDPRTNGRRYYVVAPGR